MIARFLVFVATVLLAPSVGWACAVCGPGEDESIFTFSTMLLTFLPLIMLAAIVRYAQKKYEALEAERIGLEESDGPPR